MGKYYTMDSSKFEYTCETCGKKIKSPQSLELHRKMHLKDSQVIEAKVPQVAKEDVQLSQTTESSNKLAIPPEPEDNKIEIPKPEDEDDYSVARNGHVYLAIINGLRDELHNRIKYNPPKSKEAQAILDELYKKLFALAEEEGASIW
mgnify:CR=1 FL=1